MEDDESNGVSREDTMVEHSVTVNEEVADQPADYIHALASVKMDQKIDQESQEDHKVFSQEEDKFIEKTLLHIRDRIRSGQPLSFQKTHISNSSENIYTTDVHDNGNQTYRTNDLYVSQNEYSPEDKSENVQSSGMEHFRISKLPIGAKIETNESSSLGLALSSKPSHKNNNLSKK